MVCVQNSLPSTEIPVDYLYTDMGSNITMDSVAGVAISGVLMFNSVDLANTDPFFPKSWVGDNQTYYFNATSNTTVITTGTSILD